MIKPDTWIMHSGVVSKYDTFNIQPASIDLRWSGRYRIAFNATTERFNYLEARDYTLDTWSKEDREIMWSEQKETDVLVLKPYGTIGNIYLIDTIEQFELTTDVAMDVKLKSSIARCFIELMHGGWGDPGFGLGHPSTYTLQIVNMSPYNLRIRKGQPLVQAIFHTLEGLPNQAYSGQFQGQTSPRP